jgi:hypothetical protein
MATREDLDGAFGSLTGTLQNGYSPFLPEAVGSRWLGSMADAAAIARNTDAWNALPEPPPDGDGTVRDLDAASRALAASTRRDDLAMLTALGLTDVALRRLSRCLSVT